MQLNTVDKNLVKIEARNYPPPEGPKMGSRFWRFVQGFGAFATPVSLASAFFFPPAALIAAGSYGAFQYGGYKDATKRQQQLTPTPVIGYPGVTTSVGGPSHSGAQQSAPVSDPMAVMTGDLLSNRQAMTNEMLEGVK